MIFYRSREEDKHQTDRKSRKSIFDFSNFELFNFDNEIGKNINLKHQEEKSIHFLHSNFSQLENSYTRLRIEVLDIQGEIIGKKYDFR